MSWVALVALLALRLILRRRELGGTVSIELVSLVALGLVLGVVLVNRTPRLGEGAIALAPLALALQLNAQRSLPWPKVGTRGKPEPALLFYDGACVAAGLAQAQSTEEAISALAERSGYDGMTGIEAIVLEATGLIKAIGSKGVLVYALECCEQLVRNQRKGGAK